MHDNLRKMISQMWKHVSAKERSKYAELARKMREQVKIRHLVISDAENRMQVFVWHSWIDFHSISGCHASIPSWQTESNA